MEKIRSIKLYGNYYKVFYVAQTAPVRDKINQVLKLIETQRLIPAKFFRYLENSDGTYKIRVEGGNNIYRIFCCFDEGRGPLYCFMASKRKVKRHRQKKSDEQKQ